MTCAHESCFFSALDGDTLCSHHASARDFNWRWITRLWRWK